MAYFQFLGTGPSTPITDGVGRNYRRRSSAMMQHIATYVLIDATHDFDEQVEAALSVTAVVCTNPTRDAAGGLGNLDRWVEHEIPLVGPSDLWAELEQRYGPFEKIKHQAAEHLESVEVGDLQVTPFRLETTPGPDALPNYGYHFDNGKKQICYASDVKIIPEDSARFFTGNELLVIDAAGWDKDLPTHRGALNHIHSYVEGKNERIIFTHIGRSAPPHTQASATVRRICHVADVAYDFMKIPLGR